MTKKEIARLDKMSVGELQAKFAEVVGEATRSPNRKFLIRKITEASAAQASGAIDAAGNPPAADDSIGTEPAPILAAAPDTLPAAHEKPEDDPVSILAATGVDAVAADPEAKPLATEAPAIAAAPKLSKLDVSALQALYHEVIGRPTSSTARGYLVWKIRQCQNGRVPVGPRKRDRKKGETFQVLPLRFESGLVGQIDDAWRRQGLRNRMELFRFALLTYFTSVGEDDLAKLISTEA